MKSPSTTKVLIKQTKCVEQDQVVALRLKLVQQITKEEIDEATDSKTSNQAAEPMVVKAI